MNNKPISSPHDKVFRAIMTDVGFAQEFLTTYLPKNLSNAIDPKSLVLCKNSYVDNELTHLISDVLYKANIAGEEGYLYLACEHQSSIDVLMPFRMLKYMVAIWNDHLKQTGSKKLPLIIPLVFSHAPQPYTASQDIRDLIEAPSELIDSVLFKPFTLIDAHQIPDETLLEKHRVGIMTFFMKRISERNIYNYFEKAVDRLRQLELEGYPDFVVLLLKYLLTAGETTQADQMVKLAQQRLSKPTGEEIMTIAEQFIERGRQQGEATMLLRQIQRKFGHLPDHYRQQVEKADATRLLQWGDQIFEVDSLEKLFKE